MGRGRLRVMAGTSETTERDIAITVAIQTPDGRFTRTITADWWWRHEHDMSRRVYLDSLLQQLAREAHRWTAIHCADQSGSETPRSGRPVAPPAASEPRPRPNGPSGPGRPTEANRPGFTAHI